MQTRPSGVSSRHEKKRLRRCCVWRRGAALAPPSREGAWLGKDLWHPLARHDRMRVFSQREEGHKKRAQEVRTAWVSPGANQRSANSRAQSAHVRAQALAATYSLPKIRPLTASGRPPVGVVDGDWVISSPSVDAVRMLRSAKSFSEGSSPAEHQLLRRRNHELESALKAQQSSLDRERKELQSQKEEEERKHLEDKEFVKALEGGAPGRRLMRPFSAMKLRARELESVAAQAQAALNREREEFRKQKIEEEKRQEAEQEYVDMTRRYCAVGEVGDGRCVGQVGGGRGGLG